MTKQINKNSGFLLQGAILAAAAVIAKIIGAAYKIPLTNILGDEGMGFYGYAFEVYAIALILSSFSLPLAVSKLVSARVAKKEYKNAMAIFKGSILFAIGVGLLAALVVFFGADFFADKVMASAPSAYALRVLAPGLFIVAVMGVVRGYFQGLGSMIPTAISQVIEQIVNAIVSKLSAEGRGRSSKKQEQSTVRTFLWCGRRNARGSRRGICKPPVCSVCVVCLQGSDETAVKKRSRYLRGKLWKYL